MDFFIFTKADVYISDELHGSVCTKQAWHGLILDMVYLNSVLPEEPVLPVCFLFTPNMNYNNETLYIQTLRFQ